MKWQLEAMYDEQPTEKPKTFFKLLGGHHARGEFGEVPMAKLTQVQEYIRTLRKKHGIEDCRESVAAFLHEHRRVTADDSAAPFFFEVPLDANQDIVIGNGTPSDSLRIGTHTSPHNC